MAYTSTELARDVSSNIICLILLVVIYKVWGMNGLKVGVALYCTCMLVWCVVLLSLIFSIGIGNEAGPSPKSRS